MENQNRSKQDCGCSNGCCTPPKKKNNFWKRIIFVVIFGGVLCYFSTYWATALRLLPQCLALVWDWGKYQICSQNLQ